MCHFVKKPGNFCFFIAHSSCPGLGDLGDGLECLSSVCWRTPSPGAPSPSTLDFVLGGIMFLVVRLVLGCLLIFFFSITVRGKQRSISEDAPF